MTIEPTTTESVTEGVTTMEPTTTETTEDVAVMEPTTTETITEEVTTVEPATTEATTEEMTTWKQLHQFTQYSITGYRRENPNFDSMRAAWCN